MAFLLNALCGRAVRVWWTMSIELVGTRCIVRRFIATDAAYIAAAANDRRIWLQLRDLFPHPYHLTDAEAYISRVASVDPRSCHRCGLLGTRHCNRGYHSRRRLGVRRPWAPSLICSTLRCKLSVAASSREGRL